MALLFFNARGIAAFEVETEMFAVYCVFVKIFFWGALF
jgi:hypothetical protein